MKGKKSITYKILSHMRNHLWLLVPSFLGKLPNFPNKNFIFFLCCCCFDGRLPPSSMFSVKDTPIIWSKLSPPFIFESTSSLKHSCSTSLSGKNSFSSLSYVLNSISTESSPFPYSHLQSEKYTTKITLLFIVYNFNRIIFILFNQEFLEI